MRALNNDFFNNAARTYTIKSGIFIQASPILGSNGRAYILRWSFYNIYFYNKSCYLGIPSRGDYNSQYYSEYRISMSPVSSSTIWILISASAVFILLAIGIITSVVLNHFKIRESEKRFRLLFNRVFDAIVVINRDRYIIDINESACNLFGYSKKEIKGHPVGLLYPGEESDEIESVFKKIFLKGIDYINETALIKKNGERIKAEGGGVYLEFEGEDFIIMSFRDITDRKKAEEIIKTTNVQLEAKSKSLEEKNIALKEILGAIEEEKIEMKKNVAEKIDREIMPALNKIVHTDRTINTEYYELVKNGLKKLSASSGGILHAYSKLSPREMEICSFIKNGATTKEIAETLNIAIDTVNKHRQVIRQKFNIANTNITLTTFLDNL